MTPKSRRAKVNRVVSIEEVFALDDLAYLNQ